MLNKLIPVMAVLVTTPAFAHQYYETAPVISVSPRYVQTRYPRQQCWDETRPGGYSWQHSNAGAVIGGIAGGILGNQVGGGNGRMAATAIGAATGAIVGDRLDNGGAAPEVVRRCRTVQGLETRPEGYTVVYRHDGRLFSTVMPYDPGETVRVPVSREVVYVYQRDFRYRHDNGRHRGWDGHERRWDRDD